MFDIWYRIMFPHLWYGGYDYNDPIDIEETQWDIDTFWLFINGDWEK